MSRNLTAPTLCLLAASLCHAQTASAQIPHTGSALAWQIGRGVLVLGGGCVIIELALAMVARQVRRLSSGTTRR